MLRIVSILGVRPDKELIDAVLRHEAGADEEWVRRHRRLILGLARSRYGLGQDEAEEILQATVAALWSDDCRALRAWRGEGRFSTYLTVIVCRLCRQAKLSRTQQRRLESVSLPATEPAAARELVDDALSPAERASAGERRRQVAGALAELRPRDRLVIALRFFDDREPRDMAPMLGLSPGAVRKAVHDALGRLRRQLGQEPKVLPFASSPRAAETPPPSGGG